MGKSCIGKKLFFRTIKNGDEEQKPGEGVSQMDYDAMCHQLLPRHAFQQKVLTPSVINLDCVRHMCVLYTDNVFDSRSKFLMVHS